MVISRGNKKIGRIANVSLTPGESCRGCEDVCSQDCYARQAYLQYPETRKAWDLNLRHAREDLDGFFYELQTKLKRYRGEFFRWFVAGDIISCSFFYGMIETAEKFPQKKFLVFTKQYALVNSGLDTLCHVR